MKYIRKGPEPQVFTEWKDCANDEWHPTFATLGSTEKRAVKDALMDEQGHICCYCERQLTEGDSHIEHLRPQSLPGVDPLDFANMACSCQSNWRPREPRHCGQLKGDWYDPCLFVSPLDPDSESRFHFLGNGTILPAQAGDTGAAETIHRLGLGIPKLNAMRRSAIAPFLDPDLSPAEIARLAQAWLQPDEHGRFNEFYTTIRYLFGGATS